MTFRPIKTRYVKPKRTLTRLIYLRQAKQVREHELKTWPNEFRAVVDRRKRFELRVDDRGFEVGDTLILQEYVVDQGYTGQTAHAYVTYLLRAPYFGLPDGLVIMSIDLNTSSADDGA